MILKSSQVNVDNEKNKKGTDMASYLSTSVDRLKDISSQIKDKEARDTKDIGRLMYIPVVRIRPNPKQPRKDFDESAISELAETIKSEGLLQPIIVRPIVSPDADYELIAGERRWRAVKKIGMDMIQAIVRDIEDEKIASQSLIENIQREDLSVYEKALGYYSLKEEKNSVDTVASIVGKSRRTVERYLKIAESIYRNEDLASIIRSKNLDFDTSYELSLLSDRLLKIKDSEKEADKKKYKRLMKSLLVEKEGSRILQKVKSRLGRKTDQKEEPKIEKKNFWSTDTSIGLNITVSIIDASKPEIREYVVNNIREFLYSLGAKSFEVKFE